MGGDFEQLSQNLNWLRQDIAAVAHRAGRSPEAVRCVVASKYADASQIISLYQLGMKAFGENRWQEGIEKQQMVSAQCPDIEWHFIGHLQQNKVSKVASRFSWIQSVDRESLFPSLARAVQAMGKPLSLLLQVNVSGEGTKQGFTPEGVVGAIQTLRRFEGLAVRGLMTMAPWGEDPEATRPVFRALRALRDGVVARLGGELPELSMGMSQDYRIAIQEGATMIRVGSLIFKGGDAHG